jgi:hypothetical protein
MTKPSLSGFHGYAAQEALSGKVETGFPSESATQYAAPHDYNVG